MLTRLFLIIGCFLLAVAAAGFVFAATRTPVAVPIHEQLHVPKAPPAPSTSPTSPPSSTHEPATPTPVPAPTYAPTSSPIASATDTPPAIPAPTYTPRPGTTELPLATATLEPLPTATLRPTATPGPKTIDVFDVVWPAKMEIYQTDYIHVSLVQTKTGHVTATVTTNGHSTRSGTPLPVGTPGRTPAQEFGTEYVATATASLGADGFDPTLVGPDEQPLDQATWTWSISPEHEGHQTIYLEIDVQWAPLARGQTRTWDSEYSLDIAVEKPLLTVGQIDLSSVLIGMLGSGLSIPWLAEQIAARRRKADPEGKKKPGTTNNRPRTSR